MSSESKIDLESYDREDDDEGEREGGTMLSLLASYYGIQDGNQVPSAKGQNVSHAELIDTAHFDANKYFRVNTTL